MCKPDLLAGPQLLDSRDPTEATFADLRKVSFEGVTVSDEGRNRMVTCQQSAIIWASIIR
jgi:hypothetical protein